MTWFWFLCAAAPAFLHALSNIVDQYVIREHTSGSPLLFLSFSGFVCLPVALAIYPLIPAVDAPSLGQAFWIMGAAWLFSACCIPYVYAMKDADAHEFVAVFQAAPVFVALLGYLFLGEILAPLQMLGGLVVILAAASSMVDFRRIHFKPKPFFLILLAMFIYAIFVLVLRAITGDLSWITLTFLLCLG